MTDKAISEILSRWDIMVGKFMNISPQIYRFYLRQAILVNGVIGAIVCVVFLVLGWKGILWIIRQTDSDDADYYDEPLYLMGFVVCGAVMLISVICLIDAVGHLVNPNYYAIRSIIETLKLK